jgi:23S rRNA pseudouridine1911/1915/1917 synthase
MPQPLVDLLVSRFPTAKRTTFRQMIQARRVTINGRPARSLKESVEETDRVEVRDHAPRQKPPAPTLPFPIVHEDDDILVIDKPAGLLTSTGPREKRPTALAMVREYVRQRDGQRARVGLIHRLDRDASGLLVFSKNDAAYASLKTQFFRHTVERVYAAVVRGKLTPPAGRIESRLMELPDGRVVTTRQHAKGQAAVTDYATLRVVGKRSLLEVKLETGRKHQIRAHLVERGTPILNDPLYDRDAQPRGRLMLAAVRLALDHPRTNRRMTFRVDPPREMVEIFPRGEPEPA